MRRQYNGCAFCSLDSYEKYSARLATGVRLSRDFMKGEWCMSEPDKIQDPTRLESSGAEAEQPTSELLQNLLDALPTETVTVDYLMQQLAHRSFGGLIILLDIVAVVPGISLFAGLALLLPGTQMLLGFSAPRLPTLLRQRSIDRKQLQSFGNRIIPWLQQLESRIRPRWLVLTDHLMS